MQLISIVNGMICYNNVCVECHMYFGKTEICLCMGSSISVHCFLCIDPWSTDTAAGAKHY